jgi:hypothetical protein
MKPGPEADSGGRRVDVRTTTFLSAASELDTDCRPEIKKAMLATGLGL